MERGVTFHKLSEHRYEVLSCGFRIGYVHRAGHHHWTAALPESRFWCDEGYEPHHFHRSRCDASAELLSVFYAEGRAA